MRIYHHSAGVTLRRAHHPRPGITTWKLQHRNDQSQRSISEVLVISHLISAIHLISVVHLSSSPQQSASAVHAGGTISEVSQRSVSVRLGDFVSLESGNYTSTKPTAVESCRLRAVCKSERRASSVGRAVCESVRAEMWDDERMRVGERRSHAGMRDASAEQ